MKLLTMLVLLVGLASCVGDVESARVVLSEPEDSAVIRVLAHAHRLSINEQRMLVHNNERIMEVPVGQQVVVEIVDRGEPSFTLEPKSNTGP